MEQKDEFILNELNTLFKQNKESKIDTMMLYSILDRNMDNIDVILELEDEDDVQINASQLKEFVMDFKILKNVVLQMIHKNITTQEQEQIKKDYFINSNIDIDNNSPSVSLLMSYNYFLEQQPHLYNSKLESFLDYLQNGNASAAKIAFEDLSFEQKQSIPEQLQLWVQGNSYKI